MKKTPFGEIPLVGIEVQPMTEKTTGEIFKTTVTEKEAIYSVALMGEGELPEKLMPGQVEIQRARWQIHVPPFVTAKVAIHPLAPGVEEVSHEYQCNIVAAATDAIPEQVYVVDVLGKNDVQLVASPFDAAVLNPGNEQVCPVDWGLVTDDDSIVVKLETVEEVACKVEVTVAYAVRVGKEVCPRKPMKVYDMALTSPEIATIMWMAGHLKRTGQLHDPHETNVLKILETFDDATGKITTLEEIIEILNESDAEAMRKVFH